MESFIKTLPGPMQINGSFLIIAFIFIIFYLILKKFYISPYVRIMEERDDRIKSAENRFKEVEEYYRDKLLQYEQEIKKARMDAISLREKLIESAKNEKEKIEEEAKKTAKEFLDKRLLEIENTLKTEVENAKNYVEGIAKNIAKKVIGRDLA